MKKRIMKLELAMCMVVGCMVAGCLPITASADSEYPYEINELTIKTAAGDSLSSIPENTGFIADVKFTKQQKRTETDYIFVAVYDANSSLVSIDYAQANFAENYAYNIGFYVAPHDTKIESVKAYIWHSFGDSKPLAQTKAFSNKPVPTVAPVPTETPDPNKVSFPAIDFDRIENGKLYAYKNNVKTAYPFDETDFRLYVNGVEYSDLDTFIENYVQGNTAGKLIIADTPKAEGESPDGRYDTIMVDYYATAVVDAVDKQNDNKFAIYFKAIYPDSANIGSLDIDLTDTSVDYTFTKDGAAITPEDLAEYDTLSIEYDVTGEFGNSPFYDVTVTSHTVTGECTAVGTNLSTGEAEYTVDGTSYQLADYNVDGLMIGTKYILYLDAFNRIAWIEEAEIERNMAILDAAYTVGGGDMSVNLILPNGTKKSFYIKDSISSKWERIQGIVYENSEHSAKNPVQARIVEYKLSEDKISYIEQLPYIGGEDLEYRSAQNKFGTYRILPDKTTFLYAADTDDIKPIRVSELVDGMYYNVALSDKSDKANAYRFAVITSHIGIATPLTAVAVYKSKSYVQAEENEDTIAYTVMMGSEERTIEWDPDFAYTAADFEEGEALIFDMNTSGQIKAATPLIETINNNTAFDGNYTTVKNLVGAQGGSLTVLADYAAELSRLHSSEAEFSLGAIVANNGTSFDLAPISGNKSDTAAAISKTFAGEVNIVTVDYNNRPGSRVSDGSAASITCSVSDNSGEIDWSANEPRIALVKTVDGDATDIIVYIPQTE